jgi:hypothetical protein
LDRYIQRRQSHFSYSRANETEKLVVATLKREIEIKDDYIFNISLKNDAIHPNSNLNSELFALNAAASYRTMNSSFLDNMAILAASFYFSPVLRGPAKGNSLHTEISPFNPKNFRAIKSEAHVFRNINSFGQKAASLLPKGFIEYIRDCPRQMIGLSDLPLEWIDIDGVPLAFQNDLCHLPEPPHVTVMSNLAKLFCLHYSIPEDIFERTLFMCTYPDDPIIKPYADVLADLIAREGGKVAFCRSIDEIRKTLESLKPEFLIYFTHGSVSKSENSSSVLKLNHASITGDDIVKYKLCAPLNFIFACETAPISWLHNPIPQVFFEAGAFSVVSPMLPISVKKASTLCLRIFLNLIVEAKKGIHENWADYISYNLRSALF